MEKKIQSLLSSLEETPRLLQELIAEIEPELHKQELIKDKWSIHEHATHIAVGDIYGFQKRLHEFKTEDVPEFEPLSGDNFGEGFFMNLNLEQTINKFVKIRKSTLQLAKEFAEKDWNKKAIHPEYKTYTPYIMLRHLLMHDHFHMYKIEDMGFGIGHVQ